MLDDEQDMELSVLDGPGASLCKSFPLSRCTTVLKSSGELKDMPKRCKVFDISIIFDIWTFCEISKDVSYFRGIVHLSN